MNIRFLSLAAILTTSAYGAYIREEPASLSLPSTSSATATPMIRLNRDGLTTSHEVAHVPWPGGAMFGLKAGECAMIVQTNFSVEAKADVFNLLTVPDRLANSIAEQITSDNWVTSGNDSTRCKAALAGMLLQINRALVTENASRYSDAYSIASVDQRITALAIALAYGGTTYCAHAKWNGKSTQLVPLISIDDIRETSTPVTIGVDTITINLDVIGTDPVVRDFRSTEK